MRTFVTGATGFIGQAVVRELLAAGHEVLGLARSDASANVLTQMGARAHRGELTDIDTLVAGARMSDGVIHLAFDHAVMATSWEAAAEMDHQVVREMTGALEGTDKPFVLTSGTALLAFSHAPGTVATEADAPASGVPRAASEAEVLSAAKRGVRASVVRLPPTVHGAGERGFVPMLIDLARRTGVSAYLGEGANRWPAVHRLDAARLFRLALESAAPGTCWHSVAEEGVPMRAIAETIGAGLGVPVRGMGEEEAPAHFEWLARFVAVDNPTSSALTRVALNWNPQEPDLLADMRDNGYFSAA